MGDLIAFLNARLDEDEAAARDLIESAAAAPRWYEPTSGVLLTGPPTHDDVWDGTHVIGDSRITRFIAAHDPARVLREVEAGRRILTRYEYACDQADSPHHSPEERQVWEKIVGAVEMDVRNLAAVHSDHLDYRAEWRPYEHPDPVVGVADRAVVVVPPVQAG